MGVLIPETGDGTQGLAKTSTPVSISPAPFSYKGRRGSLGVLMAKMGDSTQGLAKKSTPVRVLPRNMARITEMPAPQGLPRAQGGLKDPAN